MPRRISSHFRRRPVSGFELQTGLATGRIGRELVLQRRIQDGGLALSRAVEIFPDCASRDLRQGRAEELKCWRFVLVGLTTDTTIRCLLSVVDTMLKFPNP